MSEDWGNIKTVEIGNDKEDDVKKYILTCTFSDEQDERKVQIINMSGINVRPRVGHKVLVLDLGGGFELGICTDDGIEADLEDGEVEIYSIDSDNKKSAKVKLKPNGEVVLNDGEDYSVQYTALKDEFNKLKKDHDDFVTAYGLHQHTCGAPGAPSTALIYVPPTTIPPSTSTADITKCKIDSIRVP
jgi:hypothetical protein